LNRSPEQLRALVRYRLEQAVETLREASLLVLRHSKMTSEFPTGSWKKGTSSVESIHRPNGPGDPSPGLRPQADALGKRAPHVAA